MVPRLPIGTSDFAQIRREGFHYVDKTGLVGELLRAPSAVVLIPRPRRFGKTLNLSMLRCWLERVDEDHTSLFAGLVVSQEGPEIREHFQRYPVVFLTFKDIKHADWSQCRAHVAQAIGAEVRRLSSIWGHAALDNMDRRTLDTLAEEQATDTQLQRSLGILTRALHLATGQRAVLLIDEYDTPIHAAWSHGYHEQAIGLFRNLLSGGLKDNAHLFRGVLTGILRVAKESIFSGLNNVSVYSLLARPFSRWFGFTEAEVAELCARAGADLDAVRRWYNGYRMGDQIVYNPWSVVSYLGAIEDGFKPYWINTSSDDVLRDLLIRQSLGIQHELGVLVDGGEIRAFIDENIQLRDLTRSATSLWSFLLFCGYLKAQDVTPVDAGMLATLSIPNTEVLGSYRGLFLHWMKQGLGGPTQVDALGHALLSGDEPTFRGYLQRLIVESLSYHDLTSARIRRAPESVYQAFLVGLLVHLSATHVVDSNRESGFGRYDVSVRPRLPGGPGAVLELKVIDTDGGETAESALNAALLQVRDRDYAANLRQAGASPVWLWGAVFDGKRVWARPERA